MFVIRAALRLGRTPREFLESVSSLELAELAAFDSIDPIGDWRGDLQAGIVAAAIGNSTRSEKTAPYKALDFMPFVERKPEPEADLSDQVLAVFKPLIKKKA